MLFSNCSITCAAILHHLHTARLSKSVIFIAPPARFFHGIFPRVDFNFFCAASIRSMPNASAINTQNKKQSATSSLTFARTAGSAAITRDSSVVFHKKSLEVPRLRGSVLLRDSLHRETAANHVRRERRSSHHATARNDPRRSRESVT